MLGRAVAEETVHEYEGGRLVRTRTVREPEWLKEDFLLAQAYEMYERSLCSDCGHPKERAWHPGMEGRYVVDDFECFACTAIQDRMSRATNAGNALKYYAIDHGPEDLPPDPSLD